MTIEGDLITQKDALTIKRQAVERFSMNPDNLVTMNIPHKPPKELTYFSHKASTAVARQVMIELNLTNLLNHM